MEFLGNISAFLVNLSTSANLQSTTTLAAAAGVVALFATFMAASSSKSPKQYKKLTKPGDGKVILCAMMQSESSINYSPFVVKLFASLKGSGVNFELGSVSWDQLPTSKIPIVHFNGEILTDSQLIIKRLIKEGLAIDPDEWLNDEEENSIRAQSEMLRLAAEQFLYWGLVQERWDDCKCLK